MKDIIIGIGNTIMSDDRIGIYVARRLKSDLDSIKILETSYSGMYLIDFIIGYQRAIFIDAQKTNNYKVGSIMIYKLDDFNTYSPFSIHSIDLITALKISKGCGIAVPEKVVFIGIEIKDNITVTTSFTKEIDSIKNSIYHRVKEMIGSLIEGDMNG